MGSGFGAEGGRAASAASIARLSAALSFLAANQRLRRAIMDENGGGADASARAAIFVAAICSSRADAIARLSSTVSSVSDPSRSTRFG